MDRHGIAAGVPKRRRHDLDTSEMQEAVQWAGVGEGGEEEAQVVAVDLERFMIVGVRRIEPGAACEEPDARDPGMNRPH
jgi:hypothetical protein